MLRERPLGREERLRAVHGIRDMEGRFIPREELIKVIEEERAESTARLLRRSR